MLVYGQRVKRASRLHRVLAESQQKGSRDIKEAISQYHPGEGQDMEYISFEQFVPPGFLASIHFHSHLSRSPCPFHVGTNHKY